MEFFKIEGWKLGSFQSESQIVLEFPVVNWWNVTVGSVNVRPLMAFQEKKETAEYHKSVVQLTDQLVLFRAYMVNYLCLSRFYCLIRLSSTFPCGKDHCGVLAPPLPLIHPDGPEWLSTKQHRAMGQKPVAAPWWGRISGNTVKCRQMMDRRTDRGRHRESHGNRDKMSPDLV